MCVIPFTEGLADRAQNDVLGFARNLVERQLDELRGRQWERQGQKLEDFPHLKRWFEAIRARPAVVRAYDKAKEVNPNAGGIRTPEERAILFGQTAASVERAAASAR